MRTQTQVVASLQLLVLKDGVQLSNAAAAALAKPGGGWRGAMLDFPPSFVDGSWSTTNAGTSRTIQNLLVHKPLAWLSSRPRDVSDLQWRDFRGGLGQLAAALAGFVGLSHLVSIVLETCWALYYSSTLSGHLLACPHEATVHTRTCIIRTLAR